MSARGEHCRVLIGLLMIKLLEAVDRRLPEVIAGRTVYRSETLHEMQNCLESTTLIREVRHLLLKALRWDLLRDQGLAEHLHKGGLNCLHLRLLGSIHLLLTFDHSIELLDLILKGFVLSFKFVHAFFEYFKFIFAFLAKTLSAYSVLHEPLFVFGYLFGFVVHFKHVARLAHFLSA